MLLYSVCQDTAVLISDISGRGAYEFGDGMLFTKLGHVDSLQWDMHISSQLLGQLRFSNSGRANEKQGSNGL